VVFLGRHGGAVSPVRLAGCDHVRRGAARVSGRGDRGAGAAVDGGECARPGRLTPVPGCRRGGGIPRRWSVGAVVSTVDGGDRRVGRCRRRAGAGRGQRGHHPRRSRRAARCGGGAGTPTPGCRPVSGDAAGGVPGPPRRAVRADLDSHARTGVPVRLPGGGDHELRPGDRGRPDAGTAGRVGYRVHLVDRRTGFGSVAHRGGVRRSRAAGAVRPRPSQPARRHRAGHHGVPAGLCREAVPGTGRDGRHRAPGVDRLQLRRPADRRHPAGGSRAHRYPCRPGRAGTARGGDVLGSGRWPGSADSTEPGGDQLPRGPDPVPGRGSGPLGTAGASGRLHRGGLPTGGHRSRVAGVGFLGGGRIRRCDAGVMDSAGRAGAKFHRPG
jgi:hypothetical protein